MLVLPMFTRDYFFKTNLRQFTPDYLCLPVYSFLIMFTTVS